MQQSEVERKEPNVAEWRRDVARRDSQREAFDDGGFPDAGFPGEDRVVLTTAGEDVHDLADLGIAAEDRVDLASGGAGGEVDRELIERGRLGRSASCPAFATGGTRRGSRRHRDVSLFGIRQHRAEVTRDRVAVDQLELVRRVAGERAE